MEKRWTGDYPTCHQRDLEDEVWHYRNILFMIDQQRESK